MGPVHIAGRIACSLALCAAAGCFRHHGLGGRSGSGAAGEAAPAAGRPPTGATAASGTAGAPALPAPAGRPAACGHPPGDCFTTHPIAEGPGLLHQGDIDGDGDADLIATGIGLGGTWLELSPHGGAVPRPLEYTARGLPGYGDANRDGLADQLSIASVDCDDCDDYLALDIATGDGSGQFASPTVISLCGIGLADWHLWAADVNEDSDVEFLLDAPCNGEPRQLWYFDLEREVLRPLGHTFETLVVGDVDGDGRADLVGVERLPPQPPKLVVLRAAATRDFDGVPVEAPLPEGYGRALALLDIDGDGGAGRDIAVLVGDGDTTTTLVTLRWSPPGGLETVAAAVLEGWLSTLVVTNRDGDCGDELIAFGLARRSRTAGTQLVQVDPATGDSATVQFPAAPPPELKALLSVPGGTVPENRLFGQTAANELVELLPSSCGPPLDG